MLQQSSHLIKKLINGDDFEEYELIMIRKFFKAISYFLKFVIKSRELHSQVIDLRIIAQDLFSCSSILMWFNSFKRYSY